MEYNFFCLNSYISVESESLMYSYKNKLIIHLQMRTAKKYSILLLIGRFGLKLFLSKHEEINNKTPKVRVYK